MVQTSSHHVELIYKLFVQRTHFWMHKFLMYSQPHSKNVNLCKEKQTQKKVTKTVLIFVLVLGKVKPVPA